MNTVWIVWSKGTCDSGEIDSVWASQGLAEAREKELDRKKAHCWVDEYEVKNEI